MISSKEPKLSYSRALYVQVSNSELFEEFASELTSARIDDIGNVNILWEDLVPYAEGHKNNKYCNPEVFEFLLKVYQKAKGDIDDVVFWCKETVL